MGVGSSGVGQLDRVERQTQAGLDTRAQSLRVAEAQDTGVVDLGLDEGGVVEVAVMRGSRCKQGGLYECSSSSDNSRLGSDLEVDVAGNGLGVVRGASGRLDVWVDAVVVAGAVGAQVAQAVQRYGVLWRVEASSQVVARNLAIANVVRCLGTDEEAIPT